MNPRPIRLALACPLVASTAQAQDDLGCCRPLTFLQPFVSYTTKTYTTFTLNSESTYDGDSGQWSVPANRRVSQLLKIGKQPIQLALGAKYSADKPNGGPDGGLRFAATFLFPK